MYNIYNAYNIYIYNQRIIEQQQIYTANSLWKIFGSIFPAKYPNYPS